MSLVIIEPVTDSTLAEFATFLHINLEQSRSATEWASELRVNWQQDRPNYGFVLRDKNKIVGGIGTFYKDRMIHGKIEKLCNITSWCVLNEYRQHSMRLAMSVINQSGYSFTDFSPTKVVGATLQFLKFTPLDESQAVILNLPWNPFNNIKVLHKADHIEQSLEGNALQIYKDHATFPWLHHVLIGKPDNGWCHIVYKKRIFKGLPAAFIIYLSNKALFDIYFSQLSSHLFFKGYMSTQVECRLITRPPRLSAIRSGFNQKLYRSDTLKKEDIDYLYSEVMALNI